MLGLRRKEGEVSQLWGELPGSAQLVPEEPSVRTYPGLANLIDGCCRAALPHDGPFLGGSPTPFLGEAGQLHRGDDFFL